MSEDNYSYNQVMDIVDAYDPGDKYALIKLQVSSGGLKSNWLNITPEVLKKIAELLKKMKK